MALSTGEKIKNLRKAKGLTQKDLSEALEVSISTIRLIEQNERQPSYKLLDSLANFFNITKHEIVSKNVNDRVVTIEKQTLTVKEIYKKQIEAGIVLMVTNYYSKYERIEDVEEMIEPLYYKLYRQIFTEEILAQNGYDQNDDISDEIYRAVEDKLKLGYQNFIEKLFNYKDF
jgi:transcriptional regulator with XRE-family HTH domain